MQYTSRYSLLCAALTLTIALSTGCVARHSTSNADDMSWTATDDLTTAQGSEQDDTAYDDWNPQATSLLLDAAKIAIGTPYVRGGTTLSGFDCSGFVQWTYKKFGVKLPRTAREQAQVGTPVDRDELREGDLVAFRHPKRGYHIGIYVGNDMFIHSPRKRDVVKVSSMNSAYFRGTFLGARRVMPDEVDLNNVQQRIAESRTEKKTTRVASATTSKKSRKSTATVQTSVKKRDKQTSKKNARVTPSSSKTKKKDSTTAQRSSVKNKKETKKKSEVRKSSSRVQGSSKKQEARAAASQKSKKDTAQVRKSSQKTSSGQRAVSINATQGSSKAQNTKHTKKQASRSSATRG